MKIKILAIGKLKDRYLVDGCHDYLKRLSKYVTIEVNEFNDLAIPEKASQAVLNDIKNKECDKLLSKIKTKDYVILLDLGKEEMSSLDLAKQIKEWFVKGGSEITFVIGGSLGLSEKIKSRGNMSISFSKLTFTHGFARLILLEQIYRSFKINNNEPYNK